MKNLLLTLCTLFTCFAFTQPRITIIDNKFKLGADAEESFLYGFAEGDQVIFDFKVMKGRRIGEVEISEIGSSAIMTDFDIKKIKRKTIRIPKTGIYKFRFKNPKYAVKICWFKIQRIPAANREEFNSTVSWRTVYDTTYKTVQEDYLISRDTAIHNLVDQLAKVHSLANLSTDNRTSYSFYLPEHTVSWSYYIGVGQAGEKAFIDATKNLANYGSKAAIAIPGYGMMAALALSAAPFIAQMDKGEDVNYFIADMDNALLFKKNQPFHSIKKGMVINDYGRMAARTGLLYICLENDNKLAGITVTIKVTAVTVKENWGKRSIRKMNVTSRREAYLESSL